MKTLMTISNKHFLKLLRRLEKLKWIEIFGIITFVFVMIFTSFLFTRKTKDIYVVVRLLNSDNGIAYQNFPRQIFSENIKVGIKQKGEFGNTIAEVVNVYKYPSKDVNQDIFVTLKINSFYNKQTGQYSYDNLPLLIGDYRTFRFENIVFNGVVINISEGDVHFEQKEFVISGFLDPANNNNILNDQQTLIIGTINTAGMDGVKKYLSDQINENLKITDSSGKTVAKILSVDKRPGNIYLIQNGKYTTVKDPTTIRVGMSIKVIADKIGDGYFFQKEQSLNVGNSIFLSFENIKVVFTITSVNEVDE